MERDQTSLPEIENRAKTLCEILLGEGASLGYALRRHNAKMQQAGTPGQCIILQDVLEDWMSMRYDLSLERTAAVIHLQTMLMASTMLHEWATKMETYKDLQGVRRDHPEQAEECERSFDLRDDIWEIGGYNVASADQGSFDAIEKRNRTFLASVTSSQHVVEPGRSGCH